jgi:hypothetical protein
MRLADPAPVAALVKPLQPAMTDTVFSTD